MRINELSKKYGVDRRAIDYYSNLGLLHYTIEGSNGYRDYNEECEKELQKILIVLAMGVKPIDKYVAMLDYLPKEVWEELVIKKINEEIERVTCSYRKALEFAKDFKERS